MLREEQGKDKKHIEEEHVSHVSHRWDPYRSSSPPPPRRSVGGGATSCIRPLPRGNAPELRPSMFGSEENTYPVTRRRSAGRPAPPSQRQLAACASQEAEPQREEEVEPRREEEEAEPRREAAVEASEL